MKRDHDWTSIALLASSVVQNFQLRGLRSQIEELNRSGVSRDLREISEQRTEEQENKTRELIFQLEEILERTRSEALSNGYETYVKVRVLSKLMAAVGVTSEKFREFADKDRSRKLSRCIEEVSKQIQAGLTSEERDRGEKCAKFLVEQPALEELTRVRRRVDELGDIHWVALAPEHRVKLTAMFGDQSADYYDALQRERTAYLQKNLTEKFAVQAGEIKKAIQNNVISDDERLIQDCIQVIRTEKIASVSLLQRRLRLGYIMATEILDELEKRGIVGPRKGAEPRDILIC